MPELVGDDFTRVPKFDFGEMGITDGRVYLLKKGEDYDSSEANLRLHLAKYAKDHELLYESRIVKGGDGEATGMQVRFLRPQGTAPSAPAGDGAAEEGSWTPGDPPEGDQSSQVEENRPPEHDHQAESRETEGWGENGSNQTPAETPSWTHQ
jgi:hypothetical protein